MGSRAQGEACTHHRNVFKSQKALVAEVVRRLHFPHEDYILYTYAPSPIGVVPRF